MVRFPRLSLALGAAALLSMASCSSTTKNNDTPGGDAATGGDSPSGGPDSGQDGDTCPHAEPPPPPAADSPTGQNIEFFAALFNLVTYDAPDAGLLLGFDLDHTCTCPGPESCASATMTQHCDDGNGRDTAGNASLSDLELVLSGTSHGDLNKRISNGELGLIFDVKDYNGGPNDTQVEVAVLVSSGIVVPDPDAGADGGTTTAPPKWDGNDAWNIDPRSTTGSMQTGTGWQYTPQYVSTVGYVTNNVLVAELPSMSFGVGVGTLTMNDVILMGTLGADVGGGYRLDNAEVAARVPIASVFAVLSTVKDPLNASDFLCGSDTTFLQYKPTLCKAADLMSSPSQDNTGGTCDTMSLAIGITARTSKLGSPYQPLPQPVGCDGGIDTCP